MKFRFPTTVRAAVAGAVILPVAAAGIVLGAGTATAAGSVPSYEPDPNSVGTVSLYDASGTQITSGALSAKPFATYLAGSGGATAGSNPTTNTKATPYAYVPQDGVNSVNWSGDTLGPSTTYGTAASASYPAPLKNSANAIAKASPSDFSINDILSEFTLGSQLDPNVLQIRVITGDAGKFYTADIKVDTAAGTWSQVYPSSKTATTTALVARPTSIALGGTTTLTATVSSGVAGTVQFKDGGTSLGTPVDVAGNTATKAVTLTTGGAHTLTAAFTPTDTSVYDISSGTAAVTVAKQATTTALSVSTGSPHYGTAFSVTVAAHGAITPSGAVSLKSGSTVIGTGTLSAGKIVFKIAATKLLPGKRVLTAAYAGDVSSNASSIAKTITVLKANSKSAAALVSKAVKHTSKAKLVVRVTATVTPGGTVKIFDGSKVIKTLTLTGPNKGKVTVTLPVIRKKGTHPIKFKYYGSSKVSPSISNTVKLKVT